LILNNIYNIKYNYYSNYLHQRMSTTLSNRYPSVYFTVFKNISDDTIIRVFRDQNISIIEQIDRICKNQLDSIFDEVFVHFNQSQNDMLSSTMFFENISKGQPVKVFYTEKRYWIVFPNTSKNIKPNMVPIPKLSIHNINNDVDIDYYKEKLLIKDIQYRDLSDVLDEQIKQNSIQKKTITELKDLLNVVAPDLLQVYEGSLSHWSDDES